MKKISVVVLAMIVTFGMLACSSAAPAPEPEPVAPQEPVETPQEPEPVIEAPRTGHSPADALVLTGAKTYRVKFGDSLTSIAKNNYGRANGYYFPLIMLASRDVVKDPEVIVPGMQLTIPDFNANVNDRSVARDISPYFKEIADVYASKNTAASSDIRTHLLDISNEMAK